MKRFSLAVLAVASMSLFAVGCSSDSDSTDAGSQPGTTAAQSDSNSLTDPAATGDVYLDTCNGVHSYIETLKSSGLTGDENSPESIGEEFVTLAKNDPEWAGKSDQERADFERGVTDGIAGNC